MDLIIRTHKENEVIDITDDIEEVLAEQEKTQGICLVFALHTTCALTTADLDPGTDLDFLDALLGMLPDIQYRHPHNPAHAPDHILSSIIGPSVILPFEEKTLTLGTWQRVVLVELDGPRERSLVIRVV